MNPMQYSIYKGTGGKYGAVQFNLQKPHCYKDKVKDFNGDQALDENGRLKEGWKQREGAIFLEITSAKGKNEYDWENKIVLALSINDMGKVLYFLTTGQDPQGKQDKAMSLMHDPGAKSERAGVTKKFLNFSAPNGTAGGCLISARQQSAGDERSHTVPVSGDELINLRVLLTKAISLALNW